MNIYSYAIRRKESVSPIFLSDIYDTIYISTYLCIIQQKLNGTDVYFDDLL